MHSAEYFEDGHTFLYTRQAPGPETIRYLARPDQMHLIRPRVASGKHEPIFICSENVIKHHKPNGPQDIPEILVEKGHEPLSTCGGMRRVSDAELSALELPLVNFTCPPDETFFRLHPVVVGGALFAFASRFTAPFYQLLQEVYDVRRFCNPFREGRWGAFKSFFRLVDSRAVSRVCTSTVSRSDLRAVLAVMSWRSHPFMDYSREQLEAVPEAFLFRDYREYVNLYQQKYCDDEADVLATWKTSVRFLNFVRRSWLAGLEGDCLHPEQFFKREDEVERFYEYINVLDNHLDNLFDFS